MGYRWPAHAEGEEVGQLNAAQILALGGLVVAGLSIVVSAVVSVVAITSNRRGEARNRLRDLAAKAMADASKPTYDVVACTRVWVTRNQDRDDAWKGRADEAAEAVKKARSATRIPLKGCDESLRVLARLPSWVSHKKGAQQQVAIRMVDLADQLRAQLDETMYACYWDGRRPTEAEVQTLNDLAVGIRRLWNQAAPADADEFGT